MRLSFRIHKDDSITPIINLINEYAESYIIVDYEVYKLGLLGDKWIDISVDLIKMTATLLHEYNSDPRRRRYKPADIIAAIQLNLNNFDKPATWEESLNEK
jgi:hypothetical protein